MRLRVDEGVIFYDFAGFLNRDRVFFEGMGYLSGVCHGRPPQVRFTAPPVADKT